MGEAVSRELLDAAWGYERLFVPALFAPWARRVADVATVAAGARVVDVACGTGVLTRELLARAGPTGYLVGVDPAPGMLAVGREIEARIHWLLGSAEALDLNDDAFDCATCQFGMMFFDDRSAAAREMRRVLKPAGNLVVAVWNSLAHNPAYADLAALLHDEAGAAAADALRLPFSLGDAGATIELLQAAGLRDVQSQTCTEPACFPSARAVVEAELRGWLPLCGIHLDEAAIANVLARAERRLSRYVTGSGKAVFPTSAHLITARR